MGRALYRKYRSKSLDDIVGQKHITDTLKHALEKGAISHAYLFTGPRGTGKTSIARILAHEINKLPYDDESMHLDIIEIDAASNRRIDEIRDLRDKVHIAPTSSKFKVYIIDEVHMLTREAFNALLKTLEEPPEHAVFILATTELHKVPETIVSRTQKYTFRLYDKTEIIGHLRTISDAENIKITDGALGLLADHGQGSFRDSISMLDQISGFSYDKITSVHVARLLGVPSSDIMLNVLSSVASNESVAVFEATADLREQGAQSSRTAQSLISLLREQLASKSNIMPESQSITLMKLLLPLTAGSSTHEALEIALLDAMKLTNKVEERKPKVEEIIKKKNKANTKNHNETLPKEVKKANENNSQTTRPRVTSENDTKSLTNSKSSVASNSTIKQEYTTGEWKQVLDAVKADNGTLHSILRMADVAVDDTTMTLTFQFSLHKNQLSKPANMEPFMDYVEEAYGGRKELSMDVKEKLTKARAQATAEPALSNMSVDTIGDVNLKNINSIFGTAELLD